MRTERMQEELEKIRHDTFRRKPNGCKVNDGLPISVSLSGDDELGIIAVIESGVECSEIIIGEFWRIDLYRLPR